MPTRVPQATRAEGKPSLTDQPPLTIYFEELGESKSQPALSTSPLSFRLSPQSHAKDHDCPAAVLHPLSLFTPALLDDCFTPPPPPHSQLTTSSDFAKKIEALGTDVVLALRLPTHRHLCPSALPFLPLRRHPPLSPGREACFLFPFFISLFLSFCCCFQTGSYAAQASLETAMKPRLTMNS